MCDLCRLELVGDYSSIKIYAEPSSECQPVVLCWFDSDGECCWGKLMTDLIARSWQSYWHASTVNLHAIKLNAFPMGELYRGVCCLSFFHNESL